MRDSDSTTEWLFKATGGFDIANAHKPMRSFDESEVVEFELEDGGTARLIVGLEIEYEDGRVERVTSESDMRDLGFCNLSYDVLGFTPTET